MNKEGTFSISSFDSARDDGKEKSAPKPAAEAAPRTRPQSLAATTKEDSPAPDSKAKAAAEVRTLFLFC